MFKLLEKYALANGIDTSKYQRKEFLLACDILTGKDDIFTGFINTLNVSRLIREDTFPVVAYRLRLIDELYDACRSLHIFNEELKNSGVIDKLNISQWFPGSDFDLGLDISRTEILELQRIVLVVIKDYVLYMDKDLDGISVLYVLCDCLGYDPDNEELSNLFGVSDKLVLNISDNTKRRVSTLFKCFCLGVESL